MYFNVISDQIWFCYLDEYLKKNINKISIKLFLYLMQYEIHIFVIYIIKNTEV